MASCAGDKNCRGFSYDGKRSKCFYFTRTCGKGSTELATKRCTSNWCNYDYVQALRSGMYTIQQKVNMRYLDAWEHSGKDYQATTRGYQGNDSQKWEIKQVGSGEYSIRQKANMRFL